MISSSLIRLLGILALAVLFGSASSRAAETRSVAVKSDLVPPEKRRATVELAARLAHPVELMPVSTELKSPFNPPGFDKPDPEEQRALAAAQASAATTAPKIVTSREILEKIAARIQPSGTTVFAGKPILYFRQKMLKVGDRLTITFEGSDYELEITAIEPTTFTLRLRNEEITRPIKPGKSP